MQRRYWQPSGHAPSLPHAGVGVSVGCFAGAGYGLAVGVGQVHTVTRKSALIQPSLAAPFAHEGAMVGAFCGVLAGGGFGAAVALHIGYQWQRGMNDLSRSIEKVRILYAGLIGKLGRNRILADGWERGDKKK